MLGFGKLDKTDKLVLLLGFLVTIKIRIVGMFSVAELILMAMLILKNNNQYKSNKYVTKLLWYAVLWTIGTIASNIYNHVDQIDFIKGVFFLVVLLLIIPPIYKLLYDKPERLVLFLLGYGFGQILAPYTTTESDLAEALSDDVYVFYGIMYAVAGVSYFLYLKGKHTLAIVMRYGIAVAGLFNMARNPFLTATIAVLLLLLMRKETSNNLSYAMNSFRRKIPRYCLIGLIAILAADSIYEPLAANGTLGYEAQEKYYKQMTSGKNPLEGGRAETFMGLQLITENPFWGYGSYARDKNDAFHARYAAEHNTDYIWTGDQDRFLPGHSHIVGAWVQSGILGGLFWLYVLFMCWKVFKSGCIMCEPRMLCLLMFQSVAFLWDLCFSPFGDRTYTMFLIITLFIIYDRARKGNYQNNLVQKLNL